MARPTAIVPISATTNWLRWCLYGDPGVGKTALTGTTKEPMLILKSASDNIEPARIISNSTADVWELTDWSDAEEAYDYLRLDGFRKYKFFSFDTVTLFQELGLDNVMEDTVARAPHRKLYLPDKGEYGQNMNRLGRLFRNLCGLPMHGIFICHAFHNDDQDGNERVMPAVQGKNMPDKLCGYMNLVTYMKAVREGGTSKRILYTDKRDLFYAKDNFHVFGGRIEAPTVPSMMIKIGSKLSPTPPGQKAAATKKVAGIAKKSAVAGKVTPQKAGAAPAKKAALPTQKTAAPAKVAPAAKAAPAKAAAKATKTTKKGS